MKKFSAFTLAVGRHCHADNLCWGETSAPTLSLPHSGGDLSFAKQTYNSLPSCLPVFRKCAAFTLAEVLITLGIIGVVAALTMPALISNHRKHVVETKLSKFYSTINQAIRLSEVENGEMTSWEKLGHDCTIDEETGKCIPNSNEAEEWFNKYLAKYINNIKTGQQVYNNETLSAKTIIYFNNGSLLQFNSRASTFYINASDYEKCLLDEKKCLGTKSFTFMFMQDSKKRFEPFNSGQDETTLINNPVYGCNHTASNKYVNCAALIQRNGWKIPKNYPLKF